MALSLIQIILLMKVSLIITSSPPLMASLLNLSLLSSALLLVNGGRPLSSLLDVDPLFPFLIDNLDETLSLFGPFSFFLVGCWVLVY